MTTEPWIQTWSGRRFFPLHPRPADVCLGDIAHSLAFKCRYGGHSRRHYSVAEHSVLLSHLVPTEHALAALLHDAGEAYLPDVFAPIKGWLLGFNSIETRVHATIARALGIPDVIPKIVHEYDKRIVQDEACQCFHSMPVPWTFHGDPLGVRLRFWRPERARAKFIARYWALWGEL